MNNQRKILISSLREFVLPYFQAKGFQEDIPGEDRELRNALRYPFRTLRRINENKSVDLIDFQFDKSGDASFQFHFSQISEFGAFSSYELLSQSQASSYGSGEFGRYRAGAFYDTNPVSLHVKKRKGTSQEKKIQKKVMKWMRDLNQVEQWFKTREVGSCLVTFENLPRGVTISRGFPKFFILRETSISFMKSTRGNIFGEDNVVDLADAICVAEAYYKETNRILNISSTVFWKYTGL